MTFFTPANIKTVCGGTWLARGPNDDAALAGVGIDSRSVRQTQVFLAIRGDTHDGHAFVGDALAAGAAMAIVDDADAMERPDAANWRHAAAERSPHPPPHILKVADTRKALVRLAAAYRKTLQRTRLIAVTGSAGKTTTVRLIDAMLSASLRGGASRKSFNNDIGVPLTLLSADPADQYLVCEVGTNAPGEVGALASLIEPDIAVITCIGRAHLEGLGSVEGVAREKASLFSHLRAGGLAVAPADALLLADSLRCVPQVITFGRSGEADLRLTAFRHAVLDGGEARGEGAPASSRPERLGVRPAGSRRSTQSEVRGALASIFEVNGRSTFQTPLIGEHNALNALAAIGVARRFGIGDDAIAAALAGFSSPEMRLQRLQIGRISILNDAYNANPESTAAALRTLAAIDAPGRRVAILGDMLELGRHAAAAHREIAEIVLALDNIDMVVAVGHHMLNAAELLMREWPHERCEIVGDLTPEQARRIASLLRPDDTVLVKGSRRMRLERIIEAINTGSTTSTAPEGAARRKSA